MKHKNELPVPGSVAKDPNSLEIARVWIAEKRQQVSLRVGVWPDPAAWGILLADLARHVASSYRQESGLDELKTLERIKAGFEAEF